MNKFSIGVVPLCAVVCFSNILLAKADVGTAPAAGLANPQPGMVLSGYKTNNIVNDDWVKGSIASLPKQPAIKTIVDKSESFSIKSLGQTESNVGMWSGYLKCKRAGVYTFTLTGNNHTISFNSDCYSVRVNGKTAIAVGRGQVSADVALKVGWNKVELVCHFGPMRRPITMAYKPKESLSEAREITPATLFHDQKPEEEW